MSIKHPSFRPVPRALRFRRLSPLTLLAPLSLTLLTGCDQWSPEDVFDVLDKLGELNKDKPQASAPSFEMTDPNSNNHVKQGTDVPDDGEKQESTEEGDGGFPPGGGVPGGVPGGHNEGAAKIISEADLIQKRDNTLYALSEERGLTVIDIANSKDLRILGEFRREGRAFEMYVQDGIVFAMFRDVMVEVEENHTFPFQAFRRVSSFQVLDAKDPTNIKELREIQVPGRILDSRRIEDRVYVMSYQHSSCWRCEDRPLVRVTSFDVKDPRNPVQIQAVDLEIPERSWGPEPSLMSTDKHLFVALTDRNGKEGALSSIRSIDISDPNAMQVRADIQLEGAVRSRWQMNEYQDVLRVVTQPTWNIEAPPVVETFDVKDLASPTSLGKLAMTLPRPEQLQSVRFDKERAYAITFERTDPLFILDLKDPKKPVQRGELEIPGWVYHMEPRGDRLIGIGFDRTEPAGHLHASLFDVSDMDKPTMLSRVNFGGQWANFAENQNQIHKSFKIWDDQEFMAIPFSGGEMFLEEGEAEDGDIIECENYEYKSGVMLVDWKDDALRLRGEVSIDGEAKRSFLHNDNLFAVSNQSVASFDISNKDKPQELSSVDTTVFANKLVPAGDNLWLRRKSMSPNEVELDIVTTQELDGFKVLGNIQYEVPKTSGCSGYQEYGEVLVHDGFVYLEILTHPRFHEGGVVARNLVSFDIRDPQNPRLVQSNPVLGKSMYGAAEHLGNLYFPGKMLFHDGSNLFVTQLGKQDWRQREFDSQVMVYKLDQGKVVAKHGFSRSGVRYAGTVRKMANGRFSSWFATASNPEDESKITIFWEDIKTTDNQLSVKETAVPGIPLLVSPAGTAMLNIGFDHQKINVDSPQECYNQNGAQVYDEKSKECTIYKRMLHRVSLLGDTPRILGSEPLLDSPAHAHSILQSPDRAAFSLSERMIAPWPRPDIDFPGEKEPDVEIEREDEPKSDEVDQDKDKDSDIEENESGEGEEIEVGDEPVIPGPGIKPFPMPKQETQVLAISDTGELARTHLPQTKGGFSGRVHFVGSMDLVRLTDKIERFDLRDMSKIQSRNYQSGTRAGMCSELLPSQENLVCAANRYGVLTFAPSSNPSE